MTVAHKTTKTNVNLSGIPRCVGTGRIRYCEISIWKSYDENFINFICETRKIRGFLAYSAELTLVKDNSVNVTLMFTRYF